MFEEARPGAYRKRIEALYALHGNAVRLKLRRLGFRGETLEDLQQDVFVIALRRVEDIPTANAGPWLIRVARWVVANYRRRRCRRNFVELLEPEAGVATPDAASEPLDELHEVVRHALDELDAVDRELVLRRDLGGENVAEIGRDLGLTTRGAHVRLSAARERLRLAIRGEG